MAIAKSVCGDCGATLSPDDKFCPQCGSRIENSTAAETHHGSPESQAIRCGVCGKAVHAGAMFCESCGASMQSGAQPQGRKGEKTSQPARKQSPPQRKEKHDKKRVEPWQIITGVIVLALVVFFVYTELTREQQPKQIMTEQQSFPAQSMVTPQAIEQLQLTVDQNPKDDASLLRLANMLHDASASNSSLLQRAINTYSKYLQRKPNDPNARVDMGICYFEMARVDSNNAPSLLTKAIQEMQTAFDKNPTHQPAAFNLGIVNLNAGNLEESNSWLKKTVQLNPNSDLGKRAQQLIEQHTFQGSSN